MNRIFWSLSISSGLLLSASLRAETIGYALTSRSQVDTAYSINFLDPTKAFTSAGLLTGWSLYAVNPGDVSLRVWRPVAGGYQLIGANDYTIATTGLVNLTVTGANRIAVQTNDIIGFHYGSGGANPLAPKIIPFDYVTPASYIYQTNWPANDVAVGGTLSNSVLGNDGTPRNYSFAGTTSPVPEPAPLVALGLGAATVLRRRRKARGLGSTVRSSSPTP